jgi:RNA polymerase sigma-70 factor (ECF subfamily)
MAYDAHSTDDALRQGCLAQEPLAQQWLYRRYFGRLLGIPMRYTGDRDEAIELLNSAFLKIFEALPQFRGQGSFAGWMAKIVFHTTIDHVRSQMARRRHEGSMPAEGPLEQSIDNEAIGQLGAEEIFALVQQLPAHTRTVFSLYVVDGYKHREIAEMLGLDEGSSKWHLSQARRLLQKKLAQLQEKEQMP